MASTFDKQKRVVGIMAVVVAALACCSVSNANTTNLTFASDGDGALVSSNYSWEGHSPDLTLDVYGHQYSAPGHMLGDIYTDTPEDPSLTIHNTIDNDSSFAWTAYHVNVFLSTNFTLSGETIYPPPSDWTVAITQQGIWNGSQFEGMIDYVGGTPIAIGDSFEFGYRMTFFGLTQFSFTQELIPLHELNPLPEPSTLGLVAIGALLLGGAKLGRRRSK